MSQTGIKGGGVACKFGRTIDKFAELEVMREPREKSVGVSSRAAVVEIIPVTRHTATEFWVEALGRGAPEILQIANRLSQKVGEKFGLCGAISVQMRESTDCFAKGLAKLTVLEVAVRPDNPVFLRAVRRHLVGGFKMKCL